MPQSLRHFTKKFIFVFVALFLTQIAHGQSGITPARKGTTQLITAVSLLPVNQRKSTIDFSYRDGSAGASYPIDTVRARYGLKNQRLNLGITLGGAYYVTNTLRLSLLATPHINSFASNKGKDGKTYGVQFDLGLDYTKPVSSKINILAGVAVTRIIGGYGIASGGATRKEYLVVNENQLYDSDIGFHIIDNSWATTLQAGAEYGTQTGKFFLRAGYQIPISRTSRMNFAGALQNESVKWNRKNYDAPDVLLAVDNVRVTDNTIDRLPFRFGGMMFQIGVIASYPRKQFLSTIRSLQITHAP